MRRYYLRSFGCQMNEHDAERIRRQHGDGISAVMVLLTGIASVADESTAMLAFQRGVCVVASPSPCSAWLSCLVADLRLAPG